MPPQSAFRINAGITAAVWSGFAYGKPVVLDGKLTTLADYCAWVGATAEMVDMMPAYDVQFLVIKETDRLTFAGRGTDDFRKYMMDANVRFQPIGDGIKIHQGCYNALQAIWPRLLPIAEQSTVPIYATGHSAGAFLTRQLAFKLGREKGIPVKESYTFGEPRSFNRAGQIAYEKLLIPTWRVIDAEDVVCRIPWRLGIYKHVGQTAFIDSCGQIQINEPWYYHLDSDIVGLVKEALSRKNAFIYDHGCALYIERLKAYKQIMGL